MIRYSLVFLLSALFSLSSFATTPVFNKEQEKAIQEIIHRYLLKNPQILVDMSQSLQVMHEQEMVKMQSTTKNLIGKYKNDLLDVKRPAFGNHKGDIVIVEFFDYQCGHCKQMKNVINNLVKTDSNLEDIFIDWPIFGDDSVYAAKAVLAAQKQSKYYELHNALLDQANTLHNDKILQIAKAIGIDAEKLQKDINTKAVDDMLKTNSVLAQNLKLIATPAFIIINRKNKKFDFILGQVTEKDLRQAINGVRSI